MKILKYAACIFLIYALYVLLQSIGVINFSFNSTPDTENQVKELEKNKSEKEKRLVFDIPLNGTDGEFKKAMRNKKISPTLHIPERTQLIRLQEDITKQCSVSPCSDVLRDRLHKSYAPFFCYSSGEPTQEMNSIGINDFSVCLGADQSGEAKVFLIKLLFYSDTKEEMIISALIKKYGLPQKVFGYPKNIYIDQKDWTIKDSEFLDRILKGDTNIKVINSEEFYPEIRKLFLFAFYDYSDWPSSTTKYYAVEWSDANVKILALFSSHTDDLDQLIYIFMPILGNLESKYQGLIDQVRLRQQEIQKGSESKF